MNTQEFHEAMNLWFVLVCYGCTVLVALSIIGYGILELVKAYRGKQ